MERFFNTVAEWFLKHLSPRYLLTVVFLSGVVVFAPAEYSRFFALDALPNSYRAIASLFFLGSSFLFIAWVVVYFGKPILANQAEHKKIEAHFRNLSTDEILVLQKYAEGNYTSQKFYSSDGVVQGLVRKGILYAATEKPVGTLGPLLAYNVTDLASPYLRKERFQKILDEITKRELEARQASINDRSIRKP